MRSVGLVALGWRVPGAQAQGHAQGGGWCAACEQQGGGGFDVGLTWEMCA